MTTSDTIDTIPTGELTSRARTGWLIYQAPQVVAAFDLLAAHGFWLDHEAFRRLAVELVDLEPGTPDTAIISWAAARAALEAGHLVPATDTELAILDLAIALATDQFRFRDMDGTSRRLVTLAFTKAARP